MDLGLGTSPPTEGPVPLRAVLDAEANGWSTGLEDPGDAEDVRNSWGVDLALLGAAAAVVTAGQRLDGLLPHLTVDPTAYRGLCSYLPRPGVLALAAYKRVIASPLQGLWCDARRARRCWLAARSCECTAQHCPRSSAGSPRSAG